MKEQEKMAEMQDELKQAEAAQAGSAGNADASGGADVTEAAKAPETSETPDAVPGAAAAPEAAEPQEAQPEQTPEPQEDPRVAELIKQAEENYNRYLRAQADFDNYRRRTQKEKEELAQYASMKLVSQILPVLDNFERAFQASPDSEEVKSFMKGMDMIYRQLIQVLEAEGLRKMEPVGTPFDPEMHQAIMQVESEEYGEGIVVEVVQNGYWLKEKVLRPAMVKVSG
jgi:molecular chaperone GrpE